MNATQAMQQVRKGVRPGVRGPGCAAIVMEDGRRYAPVVNPYGPDMVERYDRAGDLIERVEPAEVPGEVKRVEWTCDELGGVFID